MKKTKLEMAKWFDDKGDEVPMFGSTYTDVGFMKAGEMLKGSDRASEALLAKAVLIVTNGGATLLDKANAQAKALKDMGYLIFVVGIGGKITEAEKAWAKNGFFYAADYRNLLGTVKTVHGGIIGGIRGGASVATATSSSSSYSTAVPSATGSGAAQYCNSRYAGSQFCWIFAEIIDGNKVVDSVSRREATLYNGATIGTSSEHAHFLTLENKNENGFPYVDMGDYAGTCVSDPDLCTNGLTVMFWLRMTQADIAQMVAASYTHQYIISSGGQKSDSRGFAFLYQQDSNFNGFKLQLQTTDTDFVIEMNTIPTIWFHVAFTFHKTNGGLLYYQNGQKIGEGGTAVKGNYPIDIETNLVIGKPNYGDKFYGRFLLDSCVIFYNAQPATSIFAFATGPTTTKITAEGQLTNNNVVTTGGTTITTTSGGVSTSTTGVSTATAGGAAISTSTNTGAATATVAATAQFYELAQFYWAFKSTTTSSSGQTISALQQSDSSHNAVFLGGAKLYSSSIRGEVLWLEKFGASVLLGDFAETCVSDPEKCASQSTNVPVGTTQGLTVSFWIKITSADLNVPESDTQQQHQYIISSGGQVSNSRGFSFLYAAEEQKFKLQLQTKSYVYMIEFDNLQETWAHLAFTWRPNGQLVLYVNGQVKDSRDKQEKSFDTDVHTKLTVGKPNHIDKHFGRFKMDELAIFYYQLSASIVQDMFTGTSAETLTDIHQPPEKSDELPDLFDSSKMFPTNAPEVGPTLTPAGTAMPGAATTPSPHLTTIKPALQPPTPNAPTDKSSSICTAKLDLVLLIDNSGSIEARGRDGYFEQIKMFIKNMMKLFKVGTSANIAIIEASSDARVIAKFGDVKDKMSFDQYINNLNYKRERSFLGKALELARTDVFAKILCKQSAKVMLVITDGYSSDDVTLSGVELRDLGVVMIGIGFGQETQLMRYTLEALSSDPKDQYTFVFCYDRLIESVELIVKKACDAAMEAAVVDLTDKVNSNEIKGAVSQDFINYFMTEINKYRRMHSAIPLTWSVELSMKAQQWAEYLANEDKLLTKPKVHYGQTLYISPKPGPISAQIAVRAWYNQIIYYDFQKPRISELNSYFVQLVWRSTTDVGVGKYLSASGKTYVVAFYNPVGNTDDGLSFNMLAMTSSAVTGVKAGSCPAGYQPNMEYCYKLYSEPVTWEEAVATCSAQKGALTSITCDQEHYFIFSILHAHTVKTTWLGLNDRMVEGSFTWVDGSPLSFNGWTNPPTIGSQKDCVQLTTDIGWQDMQCDVQNPFICKTIRPGDLIFMVTIHYPTQPWSQDLVYGTTPAAVELIQRVEKLVMNIYGTRDWFLSYTIKAFRGHVSVFIDMELRFSPSSPIDPVGPLKNVTYTEDCDGFICDLTDVQIVPAINVTYNGTCSPSCYTSCTPNCAPACCSPQTLPTYYTYEVVQVPASQSAASASQSPPPPPPPPPPPAMSSTPNSVTSPVTSVVINFPSYCAQECQQTCTAACPPECCSQKRRKRTEILHRSKKRHRHH